MIKALALLFIAGISALSLPVKAQKVDSLFFNLYTDSLKIGTYNYINVDGKLSNGSWLPLDSMQVIFTSSTGKMTGNILTD